MDGLVNVVVERLTPVIQNSVANSTSNATARMEAVFTQLLDLSVLNVKQLLDSTVIDVNQRINEIEAAYTESTKYLFLCVIVLGITQIFLIIGTLVMIKKTQTLLIK